MLATKSPTSTSDANSETTWIERRGPLSMFVLWTVMQANYVNLFIGLTAAHAGNPFLTVVVALLFSTACYTVYGLIAGMNGATTGRRLSLLAEDEFGRFGGLLAGALIVLVPAAWYCFNVIIASDVLGLLIPPLGPWRTELALSLVAILAINNVFGFNGIVKFAQYVAAPLLVVGTGVALMTGTVSIATTATPLNSSLLLDVAALQLISTSLLGNATWGNEEDFWRFAKPRFFSYGVPIIAANFLGLFVVSMLGYFGSQYINASSDLEALKEVTLIMGFGSSVVAAFLTLIHIMALNDSNLFSSLNGLERFIKRERPALAALLLPFLLLATYGFLAFPVASLLFMIAGLCGTVLPSVGLAVWCSRQIAHALPVRERTHAFIVALSAGLTVGVTTSAHGALIPGVGLSFGISVLQAWITTLLVFYVQVKRKGA